MLSIVAVSPAYFVHDICVPQPLKTKQVPRRSRYLDDSDFTADPRLRALFQSRKKKSVYSPFPVLDESEFHIFKALLLEDRDQ